MLKLCTVKFYFHLLYVANCLLSDLFWLQYGDYYSADDCLRCVCGPRHVAANHSRLHCVFSLFFVFNLSIVSDQ